MQESWLSLTLILSMFATHARAQSTTTTSPTTCAVFAAEHVIDRVPPAADDTLGEQAKTKTAVGGVRTAVYKGIMAAVEATKDEIDVEAGSKCFVFFFKQKTAYEMEL